MIIKRLLRRDLFLKKCRLEEFINGRKFTFVDVVPNMLHKTPEIKAYTEAKKRMCDEFNIDRLETTYLGLESALKYVDNLCGISLNKPDGVRLPEFRERVLEYIPNDLIDKFNKYDAEGLGINGNEHLYSVSMGIIDIIRTIADMYYNSSDKIKPTVSIFGYTGSVGTGVYNELKGNLGLYNIASVVGINTKSSEEEILEATDCDIIVLATGHYGVVNSSIIDNNSHVIIDVGYSKHDGRVVGDLDRTSISRDNITYIDHKMVGEYTLYHLLDLIPKE